MTGVDVASRYKVAKSKKSSEVAFVLEAIYKKGGVFNYPKVFHCVNGTEFKSDVTKLLEKHDVDIRRAFNKEMAKLLFKPMDDQKLQDTEKVSTIWVKNLN